MPSFPSLVEFQLQFSADMADGRWFFVKDRQVYEDSDSEEEPEYWLDPETDISEWIVRPIITFEDSDDEDGPCEQRDDKFNRYRTLPNPEIIPEFLSDAASFVQACPNLTKFILGTRRAVHETRSFCWNHKDMDRIFEIWFLRKGTTRSDPKSFPWPKIPAEENILDWNRLYWRVGDKWRPDDTVMQAWKNATGPETRTFFLDEKKWEDLYSFPVYLGDLEEELAGV
jgi:hypothetical protein